MFTIKKNPTSSQYLYMLPTQEENVAKWELISQEELERRVAAGEIATGCKLFKVEKEVKVRFEQVIHLD